MVVVFMMDGELGQVFAAEAPATACTDPRIELERLLTVALHTLVSFVVRPGDDLIQAVLIQ